MKSNRTRNLIVGGAAVLAVVAGGSAYAIADSDDWREKDQEKTLTAAQTARAEKAATSKVDGRVLEVEYEGDYGGGYEVEMQKKNGSEVDVYLDKSFKVAGIEAEEDEHGEKGYEEDGHGEYGAKGMDSGQGKQGAKAQR
ncbi:MAG: PepSY domain-containing protein [Solirubrobacterales bacterium]